MINLLWFLLNGIDVFDGFLVVDNVVRFWNLVMVNFVIVVFVLLIIIIFWILNFILWKVFLIVLLEEV